MENNLKSILYMTVNTVNHKIYVGIHITNKPYEFDNYWGNGITGTSSYHFKHPSSPFHYAVKKYGLKAFRRYTLFVFDTYEEARNMEKIIVNEEFVKRPDTYNVALGGGCGLVPSVEIEVHQYDLNGVYLKSFRSYSCACRELDLQWMSLRYAVLNGTPHNGYFWSETRCSKINFNYTPVRRRVYSYNNNGDFIKEYESIADYAKAHDVHHACVQRAIKRKTKCGGNYISLEKVDRLIVESKKRIRNGKVYQYDLDGNFIQEFKNSTEAKSVVGDKYKRLTSYINNKERCCDSYWSFEKHDKIEVPKKKRRILQYDLNGNLVKIWDSYKECRDEFSCLAKVLKGYSKQTKGFTFEYEAS